MNAVVTIHRRNEFLNIEIKKSHFGNCIVSGSVWGKRASF